MNPLTQAVILSASTLRMIPHIILYMANRSKIAPDLEKYSADGCGIGAFIKVCTRQKVFRNLFYYRLGEYVSVFIKWMLPPDPTLHIWCPSIGPGAHFEHNYATYLNAERIGSNFYCLQLVTLGNDGKMQRPIIGDDVKIFTGATVFGGITIGNHVTIGAGAVVSKNVPDNCTVVGNPAYIVKKDGQNCKIEL
ncbi:serine acetyltransferase [Xylanibacter ruminicola]|jgi:serine O-acetyltransferase|uniref:Bacterial transferase n=2 Tax=Xylanibacter ruminicola TaxID=839 RepID=D5EXX4_XYLR2|nr:serine acetyltransferase [Xylanibacter ruminicola]ADE81992.1 putative bacterial transferase [Xylanibacter ruminicola 23]GJG32154.1 serine acetyltransferase [Xylanibacter ruminicola]SEH84011.1 serine O-acetyltransferase [Xylanibacter ruminicola]